VNREDVGDHHKNRILMNYLAHAYLSFEKPGILVGNMISDFVKGRKQYEFPITIQQGIRLHRAIDNYTDQHDATRAGKFYFKSSVGLYAGAFMDIVYDHFLANDVSQLPGEGWKQFSQNVYAGLEESSVFLPEKFARMLPYMRSQDWLFNYRFDWGIENSFNGLVRRAQYLTNASDAFYAFKEHYDELKESYRIFFPDVKNFALTELNTLLLS
jgi:acyl carrier protein phosphodiesterase